MEDHILNVDFLECFRRGIAEVVYDSEQALLVRVNGGSIFFHMGSGEEGRKALSDVAPGPEGFCLVVARDNDIRDYLINERGYRFHEGCYQAVYDKKEPVPTEGRITLRNPDPCDFELFNSTYEIGDEDMKREAFAKPDFFGGYEDGKLVGFVGIHNEGAMGYLFVAPEYRGMGYAREMQAMLMNRLISEGAYPYGQIYESNEASLTLQRKMGLTISDDMIYWLWKGAD